MKMTLEHGRDEIMPECEDIGGWFLLGIDYSDQLFAAAGAGTGV
jgi:hypothetical protein